MSITQTWALLAMKEVTDMCDHHHNSAGFECSERPILSQPSHPAGALDDVDVRIVSVQMARIDVSLYERKR